MKTGMAGWRGNVHQHGRQHRKRENRLNGDSQRGVAGEKGVAPEFRRRPDRRHIRRIGAEFDSMRSADLQPIEVNMGGAGSVQPAGMGVQQRDEALQERHRPHQQQGFALWDHRVILA